MSIWVFYGFKGHSLPLLVKIADSQSAKLFKNEFRDSKSSVGISNQLMSPVYSNGSYPSQDCSVSSLINMIDHNSYTPYSQNHMLAQPNTHAVYGNYMGLLNQAAAAMKPINIAYSNGNNMHNTNFHSGQPMEFRIFIENLPLNYSNQELFKVIFKENLYFEPIVE